MARLSVFLGLLVGIAWTGWWLWSSDAAAPPDSAVVDELTVAREEQPSLGATPTAPPASTAAAEDRQPVGASVVPPPRPGDEATFELRVVDAATEEPAVGAVVYFLNEQHQERLRALPKEELRALQQAPDVLMSRFGGSAVVDARGVARLPEQRGTYVRARQRDKVGVAMISRPTHVPDGGWVVRLRADHDLTVRVTVADGAPVPRMPVGILARGPSGESMHMVYPLGASGPDGKLVVRDAYATTAALDDMRSQLTDVEIGTVVAGGGPSGVPIDFDHLPTEPIELVLRDVGRLRVEVVAPGGAPVVGPLEIYLRAEDGRGAGGPTSVEGHVAQFGAVAVGAAIQVHVSHGGMRITRSVPAPQRVGEEVVARVELPASGRIVAILDGPATAGEDRANLAAADQQFNAQRLFDAQRRVTFEAVPIGQSFKLAAFVSGLRFTQSVEGPTRPAQEVVVRLQLPDDAMIISGRALDTHGEPLSERTLLLHLDEFRGRLMSVVRSDTEGRFRKIVRGPPTVTRVRVVLAKNGIQPTGTAGTIEGFQLAPGPNDLGDVTLAAVTPLVAGVLVGEGDKRTVQLSVQRRDGERWRNTRGITHSVDEDGAFGLFGAVPPGELRLVVRSRAFLPVEPILFVSGATGLEVPLRQGGSLRARVLAAPGTSMAGLKLALVSTAAPDSTAYIAQVEGHGRAPAAEFVWRGLPAGSYDLTVRCAGHAVPIRTIAGVGIEAGDDNSDARLAPIDLRDALRPVVVTVRAPDGSNIPRNGVVWLVDTAEPVRIPIMAAGVARLAIAQARVEIAVAVPGYRVTQMMVAGDETVVLQPALRVRVTSDAGPAMPAGMALRVRLWHKDPQQRHWARAETVTITDGAADIAVAAPGDYGISVMIAGAGGGRTRGAIRGVTPRVVVVRDTLEPQVVELVIPSDAIEKALR